MQGAKGESELEAVVAMVTKLVREKQPFSLRLESEATVAAARTAAAKVEGFAAAGPPCKRWVYVPNHGMVCVER